MITVIELTDWLLRLKPGDQVAIDGLTIVALNAENALTGAYLEIGGIPRDVELMQQAMLAQLPDLTCPECARSFGPHYRGPCDH